MAQFQQRAARLAADGCDAGVATDIAEKENVKEKVAEVVDWILTGTAANDASSAEMCRDGNAQAEELVLGQGMICQPVARMGRHRRWGDISDDETEAGSESTEWPDAAEESLAALRDVMPPAARELLEKLRAESGRSAGC